jgi:hypothetical protein
MPHYFFHLRNFMDVPDPEGEEYPNFELAQAAALKYTRDMVAASAQEHGAIDLTHFIEVIGETGESMLTIKFGQAVRVSEGEWEISPGWK